MGLEGSRVGVVKRKAAAICALCFPKVLQIVKWFFVRCLLHSTR